MDQMDKLVRVPRRTGRPIYLTQIKVISSHLAT